MEYYIHSLFSEYINDIHLYLGDKSKRITESFPWKPNSVVENCVGMNTIRYAKIVRKTVVIRVSSPSCWLIHASSPSGWLMKCEK